ncbi:Dehydrodolichyl diphosphate synthase complex subunit NUS1 [Nakaseomyces bracarensis]|uniref:ditrans,polycis-polyprenyl diphosphate synthase [(2E,6E)-farnesyldiphosphate specific] n=1 Tax=Nakaseomyces bracarensis TaxID=273131 RepID=A0ABR4NQ64_9SACH
MSDVSNEILDKIIEDTRKLVPDSNDEGLSLSLKNLAPEMECLVNGDANTIVRSLKAILDSLITAPAEGRSTKTFYEVQITRKNSEKEAKVVKRQIKKLENVLYKNFLVVLYLIFAIFRYIQYKCNQKKLNMLKIIYNPSRTPQLIRQDVLAFSKLPTRLAVILEMKPIGHIGGGLYGLLSNAGEIVTWSVSAGIKDLILYDVSGYLKNNIDILEDEIFATLLKYYSDEKMPDFTIFIPSSRKNYHRYNNYGSKGVRKTDAIRITLLSQTDGRQTVVNLTKTLITYCKKTAINTKDITVDLLHRLLSKLVCPEPDLLIYFGPTLDLQGFPPWHVRLTEFFWERDNKKVAYSIFLRGLKHYSDCKMNLGK